MSDNGNGKRRPGLRDAVTVFPPDMAPFGIKRGWNAGGTCVVLIVVRYGPTETTIMRDAEDGFAALLAPSVASRFRAAQEAADALYGAFNEGTKPSDRRGHRKPTAPDADPYALLVADAEARGITLPAALLHRNDRKARVNKVAPSA